MKWSTLLGWSIGTTLTTVGILALTIFGFGFDDYKFGPAGTFHIAVMIQVAMHGAVGVVAVLFNIAVRLWMPPPRPQVARAFAIFTVIFLSAPTLMCMADSISTAIAGAPHSSKNHWRQQAR